MTDLGKQAPKVGSASQCVAITAEIQDPPDLGYLQVAWAIARSQLKDGGVALLDCHQIRWFPGAEVLGWAPDREFDVRREVNLVFETEPSVGRGHMMHTRGMEKFGRPDLIVDWATPETASTLGAMLNALARYTAQGAVMKAGQTTSVGGTRLVLEEYRPGVNAPQVNLNNGGLLLRRTE